MSRIVYVLGAGASYGKRLDPDEMTADDVSEIEEGLPVVNEICDEIDYVIGWLCNADIAVAESNYTYMGKNCSADELRQELINGFEWLAVETSRHATIDTFAKKLYLKKDSNNYGRLKYLLSTFFIVEQYLHPYDKRYDAFFANILNTEVGIPKDIFVLTWNYDVQLDIAFRDYNEFGLSMFNPQEGNNRPKSARVFKINGSANYHGDNQLDSRVYLKKGDSDLMALILKHLSLTTKNGYYSTGTTDLLFAWEKEEFDKISDTLYENIHDAEVLVIIGYTFPFFNKDIDRELFSKMPKLQKIYIQDPNAGKVKVSLKSVLPEERYNSLLSDENLILDTTNLFLPPEL